MAQAHIDNAERLCHKRNLDPIKMTHPLLKVLIPEWTASASLALTPEVLLADTGAVHNPVCVGIPLLQILWRERRAEKFILDGMEAIEPRTGDSISQLPADVTYLLMIQQGLADNVVSRDVFK